MYATSTDGIVPCFPPMGFPTEQFSLVLSNDTANDIVLHMQADSLDPARSKGTPEADATLAPGQIFCAAATTMGQPEITMNFSGSTQVTKLVVQWSNIYGVVIRTVSHMENAPGFQAATTRLIELEWSKNVRGLPYLSITAGGSIIGQAVLPPDAVPDPNNPDTLLLPPFVETMCGKPSLCTVGEPG